MILDPPNGNPNARTSTPASASRCTGKGIHTPPNVRSPVSSTTPALRRDPKGTKQGTNQNAPALDSKQDVTTKTLLSSNITPRSGSRKTRVESASSTPRSTPERTPPIARPTSMIEGRHWPSGEIHRASASATRGAHTSRPERARSVASDVQYATRSSPGESTQEKGLRAASPDNPPKFFFANDAKPRLQTRPQSQSPRLQPKFAGIHHINGASKNDTSALTRSPESGDEHPKFFYADRMPEATTPPPRFANGIVSARPPLQTIFSSYQTTSSPAPRPPSPLKEEILPISRKSSLSKPSPRRHTRLVSNGSNDIKAPDSLVNGQANISRRSSVNGPSRRRSQTHSPNTASFGFAPSRRSSFAMSDSGQDSGPSIPQGPVSAEPPPSESPATASPELVCPQSPSKVAPGQSKLDHLNELAANARRERKVLDLEISNSSLLAINRTLETEMRKQKAELRQFRRLRSSGRFPSSTFSASSRFSMPSTNDELSPTSSADEDGLDDDRFSNASSGTSDDTSFPDSASFSPTLRNSSIPVAKKRRTRSFKVDLAGQRVLLLDSQRLNQALKRCLGRTDELIADGKKALEYMVNTGEVTSVGPRVLAPDDQYGEFELGRGLLSPGLDERLENPWDRPRSVGDGWHLPEPDPPEAKSQNTEDLEGDPIAPQVENVEKALDDRPEKESGLGISSDRQHILEAEVQANLDALLSNAGLKPELEIPVSEDLPTNDLFPDISGTPEAQMIPYEDPGIDTGGETSTIEDDGSESQTSSQDTVDHSIQVPPHLTDHESKGKARLAIETLPAGSSDTESTTSEEPTVSSPGKGLGGFLRMVGGSWGV
ncbi:MAG: hypothetical protein L6R38_006695 [Xanthoria sp. 2 TBL-2021]|nr:MAG: hypothetical protein L6R38_006695 [Xanthoria sp. 2 TBL-2021]